MNIFHRDVLSQTLHQKASLQCRAARGCQGSRHSTRIFPASEIVQFHPITAPTVFIVPGEKHHNPTKAGRPSMMNPVIEKNLLGYS